MERGTRTGPKQAPMRMQMAEDTGWIGSLVRGSGGPLSVGAVPSMPAPARDLTLRDAFQGRDEP